jgi:hypothetical protein
MNSYIKQLNNGGLQLCCGGNNCPVVNRIDETKVEIIDDDGNKVTMKLDQAKLIADAVKVFEGKTDELLLG